MCYFFIRFDIFQILWLWNCQQLLPNRIRDTHAKNYLLESKCEWNEREEGTVWRRKHHKWNIHTTSFAANASARYYRDYLKITIKINSDDKSCFSKIQRSERIDTEPEPNECGTSCRSSRFKCMAQMNWIQCTFILGVRAATNKLWQW